MQEAERRVVCSDDVADVVLADVQSVGGPVDDRAVCLSSERAGFFSFLSSSDEEVLVERLRSYEVGERVDGGHELEHYERLA